jgi:hypothetical protein
MATAFCALAAPAAAAQAAQSLAGEWSGSETIKGRPVAVNLKLPGTESAKGGTEFHYGVPRSCGLKAEYSGESEGQQFFSFTTSTGGVCDRLISGFLAVRLERGGALTYEASSADRKTGMSGVLRRSGENVIAKQLVGEWAGPATASRPPIRFEVSVRQGTIGDEAAQLHYGAPRSCQLTAEYSGIWSEQAAFGIKNSTGGYCDRLIGGLITMKTDGDGALTFGISLIDGSAGDKGTLRRSP